MNKETRQFVWGIILLIVCTYGTFSFYLDLKIHLANGITMGQLAWDLSLIALEAFGAFMGGCYVLKNI
jgi:hypothetical protein